MLKFSDLKRWPFMVAGGAAVVAIGIAVFAFVNSKDLKATTSVQSSPPVSAGTAQQQNSKKAGAAATGSAKQSAGTGSSGSAGQNASAVSPSSAAAASSLNADATSSDEKNFKEFFKNDAFLGDSISEGLSFYDYLDDSRVIAVKGLSITKAIDEADKVIALKPQRVFILLGVNDIDDRTPSSWLIGQYTTLVEKLKTKLPDSQIYVTSILPVLPSLVQNPHINNAHIQECNEGLIKMAAQENVTYVNLASILNSSNTNLYEDDGIHFKSEFYKLWLNYLEGICK